MFIDRTPGDDQAPSGDTDHQGDPLIQRTRNVRGDDVPQKGSGLGGSLAPPLKEVRWPHLGVECLTSF
jgi:hypothetical protein